LWSAALLRRFELGVASNSQFIVARLAKAAQQRRTPQRGRYAKSPGNRWPVFLVVWTRNDNGCTLFSKQNQNPRNQCENARYQSKTHSGKCNETDEDEVDGKQKHADVFCDHAAILREYDRLSRQNIHLTKSRLQALISSIRWIALSGRDANLRGFAAIYCNIAPGGRDPPMPTYN